MQAQALVRILLLARDVERRWADERRTEPQAPALAVRCMLLRTVPPVPPVQQADSCIWHWTARKLAEAAAEHTRVFALAVGMCSVAQPSTIS